MTLPRATRWATGTFVIYLASGAALTFTGRIRFARDVDGYYSDYEGEGDSVMMFPSFAAVVAVVKQEVEA